MKRREFITLLGGAAAWPIAARAQQTIRRLGMLLPAAADDAEFQTRVRAFLEGLQQSGWTIGQNVRIDSRWATANAVEIRRHAAELAALAPDAILTSSSPALAALQQATRTAPIVFVNVIDPVGSGFVDSLARPGGNTTGFLLFEYSLSGKWLELLKQIAPNVTRAAVFRDTGNPVCGDRPYRRFYPSLVLPAYYKAIAGKSYCSNAESSKRKLAHAMRSLDGTSTDWCLIQITKPGSNRDDAASAAAATGDTAQCRAAVNSRYPDEHIN
jgi:ABC transporter substrate binding protein